MNRNKTVSKLTWYFNTSESGVVIKAPKTMMSQVLQVTKIYSICRSDEPTGLLEINIIPRLRDDSEIQESALEEICECLHELGPHFPEEFEYSATIRIYFPKKNGRNCGLAGGDLFLKVVDLLQLSLRNGKLPVPKWDYEILKHAGGKWLLPGEALAAELYPERI